MRNKWLIIVKKCFIPIVILLIVLTIYSNYTNFVPWLKGMNSNTDSNYKESAGIYIDSDEFLDKNGAGQVLYTIVSGKEVVVSPNGFFKTYALEMFNNVSVDNELPATVNFNDLPNKDKYVNIGVSLAKNHKTLFPLPNPDSIGYNLDPYIFINPEGLDECKRVVILNDDEIKMYVTSADLWFGKTKGGQDDESIGDIVKNITKDRSYWIHNLIGTIILFSIGYVILLACIYKDNSLFRLIIAFPFGISVWTIISIFLLLFHLKYTFINSIICCVALVTTLVYFFKDKISVFNPKEIVIHYLIAIVMCLIMSIGILPIINSFDSYLFIYDYGNLIYNNNSLDYSHVGSMMGVTSVVPALMVSYLRFIGAESLLVFHGMLVISAIGCLIFCLFKDVQPIYGNTKAIEALLFVLLLLLFVPAILKLELQINSLSYFMVFVTILILLVLHDDIFVGSVQADIVYSMLFFTLTFLRIEGAVVSAFIAFCIGEKVRNRKRVALITIPTIFFQGLYLAEIVADSRFQLLKPRDFYLSKSASFVIALSLLFVFVFIIIYNTRVATIMLSKMKEICCVFPMIICIGTGIVFPDKFISNIKVVFANLSSELWSYFPYIIIIMLVLAVSYRKQIEWIDCFIIGYILLYFGVSMGREELLRIGWGDSYNRMLCAIVPLVIYTMVLKLIDIYSDSKI